MHNSDEHFGHAHDRMGRAQLICGANSKPWGAAVLPAGVARAAAIGAIGGGFGDSFRIGRMLASGDLRLIALYLIEQQPRHGYDLIKAIEEKTGGIYSPRPGRHLSGVDLPRGSQLRGLGRRGQQAALHHHRRGQGPSGRQPRRGGSHARPSRPHRRTVRQGAKRIGKRAERNFKDAPPRPDRDMDDVAPEVNEARKALKQAIKEAAKNRDPANQRRLAENPAAGGGRDSQRAAA